VDKAASIAARSPTRTTFLAPENLTAARGLAHDVAAEVTRVNIADGEANAVKLDKGEADKAKVVVSTADRVQVLDNACIPHVVKMVDGRVQRR
jgi:hypothetical protein